jgi:hypothetical protein
MSDEETDEINQFLDDISTDELLWIGLTDKDTEGDFVWASTSKTAKYTNWNTGQPSGFDFGEHDDDCVHLAYASKGRTWNDESCYRPNVFALCQTGLLLAISMKF